MGEPFCSALARHASGYEQFLEGRGYARRSIEAHRRLMVDLGRWLAVGEVGLVIPSVSELEAFVAWRQATGRSRFTSVRGLRPLIEYLGMVLPPRPPEPETALDRFVSSYRCYLVGERGLAELTLVGYLETARVFLEVSCSGDPERLGALGPAEVASFVVAERARGLSPRTVNEVVVRLRSLLRVCYLKGLIDSPLSQATPWMANSRAGSLPRGLEVGVGARLLASCDRSTLVGARDFAIMTVLVRLGLRAGEVAALCLDDLDWHRGELVVRGKGECFEQLPLPVDVGQALADYLTYRGRAPAGRSVFSTVYAPLGPMSRTAVRAVVRQACLRVGVPDCGTHRFRHHLATGLLADGASLPEIGQLLRHHHLQTTAIYATVDANALAAVAGSWPGTNR